MGETTNLGLKTYNKNVEDNKSFQEYQLDLSNVVNSNMTIIDAYLGNTLPNLINNLSIDSSGSMSTLSGSVSDLGVTVTNMQIDLAEIGERFIKLDEFEDSGQADFTGISQSYTHIIIIGTAVVTDLSGSYGYVSMDFNGDSNTSNYFYLNWQNTGSATSPSAVIYPDEVFSQDTNDGAVAIARTWQENYDATYGNSFFAIIPNYSGSTGLYKSVSSVSTVFARNYSTGKVDLSANIMGGYWNSSGSINRIRIFASLGTSTRYNLDIGTKISMYGIL